MGYLMAICSVLLVTAAQLTMKYAMSLLPPVWPPQDIVMAFWHFAPGTVPLAMGIAGYVASMGCWYVALKYLDLSKAYSLLSLSYILVWAAAIWLPGWHEGFSPLRLVGVVAIMAGVILIVVPRPRSQK